MAVEILPVALWFRVNRQMPQDLNDRRAPRLGAPEWRLCSFAAEASLGSLLGWLWNCGLRRRAERTRRLGTYHPCCVEPKLVAV